MKDFKLIPYEGPHNFKCKAFRYDGRRMVCVVCGALPPVAFWTTHCIAILDSGASCFEIATWRGVGEGYLANWRACDAHRKPSDIAFEKED